MRVDGESSRLPGIWTCLQKNSSGSREKKNDKKFLNSVGATAGESLFWQPLASECSGVPNKVVAAPRAVRGASFSICIREGMFEEPRSPRRVQYKPPRSRRTTPEWRCDLCTHARRHPHYIWRAGTAPMIWGMKLPPDLPTKFIDCV